MFNETHFVCHFECRRAKEIFFHGKCTYLCFIWNTRKNIILVDEYNAYPICLTIFTKYIDWWVYVKSEFKLKLRTHSKGLRPRTFVLYFHINAWLCKKYLNETKRVDNRSLKLNKNYTTKFTFMPAEFFFFNWRMNICI